MKDRRINVCVVGLHFGSHFIPIYKNHPNVKSVAICDLKKDLVKDNAERFDIDRVFYSLEEVCSQSDIDAVHLDTPPTQHAKHSISVLESGKHCACTIPMGMSIGEIEAIINSQRNAVKNYMMMETAVYTREFLFIKELIKKGEFGTITFARGAHLQDMEGWPDYWIGFPPLAHITHAFSPVLALLETRATKVHCFGSGKLRHDLIGPYSNPFPFETAIFKLANTDVAAEVSRFMFQTARPYTESFAIYGDKKGFEWQQVENEPPLLYTLLPLERNRRGRDVKIERIKVPDRADLLPKKIAQFTTRGLFKPDEHSSFYIGGGHGGAHPHLVHEFVTSIIDDRKPWINEVVAAHWTAAGICAHESAMQEGKEILVPEFT
jgi:predicted dehydrogenase